MSDEVMRPGTLRGERTLVFGANVACGRGVPIESDLHLTFVKPWTGVAVAGFDPQGLA